MSHPYPLATEQLLHQNYRIVRILGSGGFGVTYLTEHIRLGNRFVIKEYFPSELAQRLPNSSEVLPHHAHRELFERGMRYFFREAQLLHRLKHPNIVPVTDLFEANGTAYFVMPHIGGETFSDYLRQHPQPNRTELNNIFLPLLDALEYLHNQRILHRDIKPQNILLADNTPILIDFGAARRFAAGPNTQSSLLFISQGYSPIEQYGGSGKLSPASDLYALSACLYQAVTGKLPPPATDRIVRNLPVLADNPDYRARYPQAWLAAVDKGFSLMPPQRFQTVEQMRQALNNAANGRRTAAPPPASEAAETEPLLVAKAAIPDAAEIESLCRQVKNGNKQALKRLKRLAEQGVADAQNYLGEIYYYYGYGVGQNYQQALKWYRKAAEQGHAAAQFHLGVMYEYGYGVDRDYEQAVVWLRKAAEQGHAAAQANLGWMYEHGYGGVDKDYEQAVAWYRKAAEQGLGGVQYDLANMYEYGKGVAQDREQAVYWYRQAARQNNNDKEAKEKAQDALKRLQSK